MSNVTELDPALQVDVAPGFNDRHSLAIRIWHWTFFVVLTSTLVTVLFASTLFKTQGNIGMVQEQLQGKGVVVNKTQARAVAHDFSDKLWNLHKWIGFVLCALLLSRAIIELAEPAEDKFLVRLKRALGGKIVTADSKLVRRHYIQVKTTYLAFYFLILLMALTGLGLAFEDVPVFRNIRGLLTQVHVVVQYFIYAFILIHLTGVIRADTGKYGGIISGMIHGKGRP
ncbi:MAG TPA: cytochrome b/b6 domain-containing protein [Puia sp.]|jgi:cytochrome b561|nr:cytochrome b/b6 domain-containing protein [Puia sp.]